MAPSHHYNLLKEGEDLADETHEPHIIKVPVIPPWWKVLFYMLLAFSAGLGVTVGVILASTFLKPTDSAPETATASSPLSTDIIVSATSAAAVTLPTASVDQGADQDVDSNELDGKVLDCGWSPSEARAKGCVYDVMMQDWVPVPCYDPILTERYLAKGNYTWYADGRGEETLSDEEMRKGEHGEAWMGSEYHEDHCIFSWEKLIRALRTKQPISQELLSYDHVLHCSHTLGAGGGGHMRKRGPPIGVGAPTNYAKCALYNTWKSDFIPDKHSSSD